MTNKDKTRNATEVFKDNVKETADEVTRNQRLEADRRSDQMKGNL